MHTEEKTLYTAILLAILIISTILGYFIFSIIRQQQRYRKLAKAKINAEITTLENERKRIAGDLHDEVGPLLSAIKLQINHLDTSDEFNKGLIEKSSRYIDETIAKMREISNDLLPNLLVRKGLIPAIDEFINRVQGLNGVHIKFLHGDSQRVDQQVEVNVYRMVQEIVHNTLKHAQATELTLQLLFTRDMVRLASEDNGKGFDYKEMVRTKSGLGLFTLQSRAEVMGADLVIDSSKGKGTRYLFEIPLGKSA